MKSFSIIQKNFKLLIRSKASAFTVLIGPLLIILLVGLVFSGKASYELSVGYYAPEKNNLTQSFVDSLQESNFYVQEFSDEQSCVRKIEQDIIHTCIIFPEDFQVSDEESKELRFLVDYSRINLVYKVINAVSGILEAETAELSYSLTQVLLSRINLTLRDLNDDLVLIDGANPKINLLTLDLQKAKTNTESMNLEMRDISLTNIDSRLASLNETISEIQEKGLKLINDTEDLIEDLGDYENVTDIEEDFEDLRNATLELYNETPEKVERLQTAVKGISSSLSKLEEDLNKSKVLNKDTQAKLDSAKNNLASIQISFLDLKKAIEKSKKSLESIDVTSAETIVSPVNTKIEPVVSETSKLTFTFPFLLVLVIMFVALLLSSTLIMFEKNSKAVFRNIVTPTTDSLFVVTTFVTSFIVIVLQTIIILGLANFFMHIPLFKNALLTLLIILVTSTFFIILGMAIGYLFSTHEGAIMTSIVLGSVFLFLSNLVVPLESLSPFFAGIIKYNPYVLASELLRKSLLFTVSRAEAWTIILILFGASVIIFVLILVLHGIFGRKKIKEPAHVSEPEVAPRLALESKPTTRLALLKFVSNMTQAEFEENVNVKKNKIADVVEKKIGDTKLANKLRKTVSKKDIIKILVDDIKKHKEKPK